jgi:predicted RND superfamily exporter protein
VIAIALALTLAGLYVTVTRFAINTNTERLISADVPWRKALENYSKAFSRGRDLIVAVVVVEGDMPEVADEAADKLAQALAGHPGVLRSVRRPDSGPFFDKYGLLFLPSTS